jgi:uncharacterized protein
VPRWEQDSRASGPVVQAFTPRGFMVDGNEYRGLVLTPERAGEWTAPALAELTSEHLAPILALHPAPEFLILGTGARIAFPPLALTRSLEQHGIGLEVMDSRAAARTWGMLRGEERWIAAALMPLG